MVALCRDLICFILGPYLLLAWDRVVTYFLWALCLDVTVPCWLCVLMWPN